ncbi:MAG: UV DNA damage repair endonuclease UvsE, partial [Candidatus Hodarchaeota archaeon]
MDCRSSRTFRLKNYSKERLKNIIEGNLNCLQKVLEFNRNNKILFFRITSDLIPFASHPVLDFEWKEHFKTTFEDLGAFIRKNKMRITMHPGQYTILNSINKKVYENSLKELIYHVNVLDSMHLDSTAKVQIHVGGVYGDKNASMKRFISRYFKLDNKIKNRLVIENDDKNYNLSDCLQIYQKTDIPIIFDVYHHQCNNSGEKIKEAFEKISDTWKEKDGIPIIHYSSEHPIKCKPSHAETIDLNHFKKFINLTRNFNFDLMLEIKDKEISALKA